MESNKLFNFPDKRFCYVVEGKDDENKLKKLNCEFVIKTNGVYIRNEIINYLKLVKKSRDIILVLDPDGPGRKIKEILDFKIGPSCLLEVDKKDAISFKKNKVGIAEVETNKLKDLLRPFILHDISIDENFSLEKDDLIDLNLTGYNSTSNKKKVIDKYSLPYNSLKNIYEYLLILSVTKKDLQELLNE